MPPNIQETDLENFREEDDEDLKVFHKTKKATKMVWLGHTTIKSSNSPKKKIISKNLKN